MDCLTENAIEQIMCGEKLDSVKLQVLAINKYEGSENNPGFRVSLSDGKNVGSSFVLSSSLGSLIMEGVINDNCIVLLKQFTLTSIANMKIIMVTDLDVLADGREVGVIGFPRDYEFNANLQITKSTDSCEMETENGNKEDVSEEPKSGTGLDEMKLVPGGNAQPKSCQITEDLFPDVSSHSPLTQVRGEHDASSSDITETRLEIFSEPPTKKMKMSSSVKQIFRPINDVSPYNGPFNIKARVTHKTCLRNWHNSKTSGSLFSITLTDETATINSTLFNDVAQRFYPQIEANQVYEISHVTAVHANSSYSTSGHDFELRLNAKSVVTKCDEDESSLTQIATTPLAFLDRVADNTMVDVVAVCTEAGEIQQITSRKDGSVIPKRTLKIVDQSLASIELNLWGEYAKCFNAILPTPVVIRNVRVGSYNGKNLNTNFRSSVSFGCPVLQAKVLLEWYKKDGCSVEFTNLSNLASCSSDIGWKFLSDVGDFDREFVFKAKATVMNIKKDNLLYKGCTREACGKRLHDNGKGLYYCQKCDLTTFGFSWKLALKVTLADCTSSIEVTLFGKQAEKVLGYSPSQIAELLEKEETGVERVLNAATLKTYVITISAKRSPFKDQTQLSFVGTDIRHFDYRKQANTLLEKLRLAVDSDYPMTL